LPFEIRVNRKKRRVNESGLLKQLPGPALLGTFLAGMKRDKEKSNGA
jgi:hypothetical protein